MKLKNIIITSLTVLFLVLAVSLLLTKVFDFHLNLITYHTEIDGDYTFTFKGSFKTVRKVRIEKNSKKVCTLPFNSTSDVFSDSYSVRWDDFDFDGERDVALVSATDEDGDIHYTVFLYDKDQESFVSKDVLADLPNLTVDSESKHLYTSYTEKTFLEEQRPNTPDNYEEKKAIVRYEYIDGEPLAMEERAITFYSDTYYYCYSIYKHNDKYGELTYVDEKWFHPDDLNKHPLSWE